MILKAPGKINLALNVIEKREDGYHEIDLVSVPLKLHDSIEINELVGKHETYLTCDDFTLVCDESNLAIKAYRAMQERYGLKKPFRIEIFKQIPVAAGLAGGSADAAAVIRAVAHYLKPAPRFEELLEVAAMVGSDVPFCMLNHQMRVQGRGEILSPINMRNTYHVLIVKPKQGLNTKEVYDMYDKVGGPVANVDVLIRALMDGDEKVIAENLTNSLQDAAISMCPEVGKILAAFKEMGFTMYSMSGSGSACFVLSNDYKRLQYSTKFFMSKGYKTYLTAIDN